MLLHSPIGRGRTRIDALARRWSRCQPGTINHHWTKNVIASPDGTRLYVTGKDRTATSRTASRPSARSCGRSAGGRYRDGYAPRVRQTATPNGLAGNPSARSGPVQRARRDQLSLVPTTSPRSGGARSWLAPATGAANVDERVAAATGHGRARDPVDMRSVRTSPLGLTLDRSRSAMPSRFQQGVRRPARLGGITGPTMALCSDLRTHFVDGRPGHCRSACWKASSTTTRARRPLGVAMDGRGALLVVDDVQQHGVGASSRRRNEHHARRPAP